MIHPKLEKAAGTSPGTLIYSGPKRSFPVRVTVTVYDEKNARAEQVDPKGDLKSLLVGEKKIWVDVQGIHEPEIIRHLGAQFGIHALTLEDIVNPRQRPKSEDYGDYLFFVLRMLPSGKDDLREQVSIVLGKKFVLSFRELEGPLFAPISERLLALQGRLPVLGPDYLAYRLMDCMSDTYFNRITQLEEQIENAEEEMLEKHGNVQMEKLFALRHELVQIKKSAGPLRDFVTFFRHCESPLLSAEIRLYLMDFADHALRLTETLEALRENLSAMMDLHFSQNDRRLNEVMKVLTVISTIFIPLGFLTSWFGMNFDGMFEYHLPYAYAVFVGLMGSIIVGLLMVFRKKGWL